MNRATLANIVDALIRPEVKGFEPYLPGRSLESVRRELGLKHMVKLASNENPLGPSPRALKAIAKVGKAFYRYPDGASVSLRQAAAKKYKVPANEVIIGAGSDELIELLGKTFLSPDDSIVVSTHAFIRYQMAADLMGARTIHVPMNEFTHDLKAMADAIEPSTKMVFIANPNNPTGTYNTEAQLEALLARVAEINAQKPTPILVVVDEAYYEYAKALTKDYPDTLALRQRYPNLLVLRTFSKVYALAGLRIGYGFADPSIIRALDRARPPFNVSTAGQAAAEASLADTAQVRRGIQLVKEGRKMILPVLATWGLPVVPSAANFFLMDIAPHVGQKVFEAMLKRGLIIRALDEYGFPHHIRVTYGLPSENKLFLNVLREVLDA